MNQTNILQKNNLVVDSDESNKNDEDLLAFSSKYKTTMYKEEDLKEDINESQNVKRKISCDSTSFSISQELNNLSGISKNINNILKDEILHRSSEFNESKNKYRERQRKMSSPLCCYFEGYDKFLSKTQKTNIDMNNSQNFVKKEVYYSSSKEINHFEKNNFRNSLFNNKNKDNLNFKLSYQNNNNYNKSENINNNKENKKNKNEKKLSFNGNQINLGLNNTFIPNQNLNYVNFIPNLDNMIYFNNNSYQQQLYNFNYINFNNINANPANKRKLSYNLEEGIIGNYFNNILNLNNNNIQTTQGKFNPILFSYNDNSSNKSIPCSKNQGEKKPFDKRKGDWLCPECHNLNFAFRVICNRCQIPKPCDTNSNSNVNNSQ